MSSAAASNERFPFAKIFFEQHTSPTDLHSLQQLDLIPGDDLQTFLGVRERFPLDICHGTAKVLTVENTSTSVCFDLQHFPLSPGLSSDKYDTYLPLPEIEYL